MTHFHCKISSKFREIDSPGVKVHPSLVGILEFCWARLDNCWHLKLWLFLEDNIQISYILGNFLFTPGHPMHWFPPDTLANVRAEKSLASSRTGFLVRVRLRFPLPPGSSNCKAWGFPSVKPIDGFTSSECHLALLKDSPEKCSPG